MNIKELFTKRILEAEKESTTLATTPSVITKDVSETRFSLREVDVGITHFVSPLPGFHGIIKQRFSDFNVHEIDKDGNVTILNSYDLPDESIYVQDCNTPILDDDTLSQLENLVNCPDQVTSVDIDVTLMSKEERRGVHQFIKAKYGSTVSSNTVENEEKKSIVVERSKKDAKNQQRAGHLPKFLHFVMNKSNMDTTFALSLISSKLRLKINNFQLAGTKDKRANTTQWVSLKNAYASQLKNIKNLRNIWIGNFTYKDHGLALGDLKGNNFEIALRDVRAEEEVIVASLNQLKEKGFINYFGMQRFGNNAEAATHDIGRYLIKEEFKMAVETILKPRKQCEDADMRSARDIYAKTHDAGKALSALKCKKSVEAKLLTGLKENGAKAFVNALDCLPRNLQLLYLHAYQAFLWNKVASRRIAEHGLKVLEGDLVYIDLKKETENVIEDIQPPADRVNEEKPCPVRQISLEEVDNFTIYDIVLPVPGSSNLYPKNEISDWFREELAADQLTIEDLKGRIKKYAVAGGYRKIIKKPGNLSWRFVRYSNPEEDLILNDADIISGRVLPEWDGPKRAVIIKMDLDSSVYATMALREILRMDTSFETQSQLNGKRPLNNENDSAAKRPRSD